MLFDDGQHGWLMALGILHLLIFWILAILGSFALWKWFFGDTAGSWPAADKTPLQILQERYARGELGRNEYEEKKRDLEGEERGAKTIEVRDKYSLTTHIEEKHQ